MGFWSGIKTVLNDTLATDNFEPLDLFIKNKIIGNFQKFEENGVFTVPPGITDIYITACGQGGSQDRPYRDSSTAGGGGDAIVCEKFSVTPLQKINISFTNTGEGRGKDVIIGNLKTLQGGYSGDSDIAGGNAANAGGYGGGAGGSAGRNGKFGVLGIGGKANGEYEGGGGGSLGKGADADSLIGGSGAGYGGGAGGVFQGSAAVNDHPINAGNAVVFISWGVLWAVHQMNFIYQISRN